MTLATGSRLEHYEIVSAIGAGGMGEVYRARDTKLGRDVAFKVLPAVFANDADRLSRFQREAHLLASLNHPNIAQIYGVVESDQTRGIVMELVEGETLQARLKRGSLPFEEALPIARQVAEALEAAHDRGIIHRDLKPGNIMLDAEGKVKVLDFGLARASGPEGSAGNLSNSPTLLTAAASEANVLMGTAAYMSPEQVRGRVADERSDVWAFGCVLYEMLTGLQPFTGETIADLIGGVARIDPDWNALPTTTPPAVRSIVKRCLEKDRRRRIHSIGDVRLELEEAQSAPAAVAGAPPKSRERIAWGIAAAFMLTTVGVLLAATYFWPSPAEPAASRFLIEFPRETTMPTGLGLSAPWPAVSPDGRYVAFGAVSGRVSRLWLRPIGSLTAQVIPGTEGVGPYPFWSPDGRFIGFFAGGKLKKVAIAGGPPQILCDAVPRSNIWGGTWNQDDVILFAHQDSVHRVAAGGGVSTAIRTPDKSKNEVSFTLPSFLPDGRHFLYVAGSSEQGRTEIRVGTLDSNDDKSLFASNSQVLYAHPDHLLFVRDGTLMAQPFDARSLSLTGDIFPVAEQIAYSASLGVAAFSVSANGTVVYRSTPLLVPQLTWFDRSGKSLGVAARDGFFQHPYPSPDQSRLAVQRRDTTGDIWVMDSVRGTSSRFTFDPADDAYPVFSPDGKQIVFTSRRGGVSGIYAKAATGVGSEDLIQKVEGKDPGVTDWSSDGKTLLYFISLPDTGYDVWALPLTGERKPYPLLNQKYFEARARLSPDGRWMSYTSNETGRNEIYVQTFPPSGGKWQVSANGGRYAYWRRDGKEIVFDSTDGQMMAVDVKLGATFEAGVPHELFEIPGGVVVGTWYVITPDAQRFLIPVAPQADRPALTAVLNWTADIKK